MKAVKRLIFYPFKSELMKEYILMSALLNLSQTVIDSVSSAPAVSSAQSASATPELASELASDLTHDELLKILQEWIIYITDSSPIQQQTPQWYIDRVYTIGGSSIATIMGINPYSTMAKLISEKSGLTNFAGDIKPQWGNLFEDVIKRYVEWDKKCIVYGEDLYVRGGPGTSYSPDGLAVLDVVERQIIDDGNFISAIETVKPAIVLLEFKCPYSRIPNGMPPGYYVPQVKMGMELLKLPTIGLFVEGVFRRCTWDDVGNNKQYDKTLVPKKSGKLPLAYGIIGFYIDSNTTNKSKLTPEYIEKLRLLLNAYNEHFEQLGNKDNEYLSNDLGDSPPALFTTIMDAFDKKIVTAYYLEVIPANDVTGVDTLNADLAKYTEFCKVNNVINLGILPWKLFRIDYHYIQKEEKYLDKWLPIINDVIVAVKECRECASPDKIAKYNEHIAKLSIHDKKSGYGYKSRYVEPTGFSD